MARPRNPIPTYRLHKSSGQAVVTVRGPNGKRRDVLLGRYLSVQSKLEFRRIIGELAVSPAAIVAVVPKSSTQSARPDLTINELAELFMAHAEEHYRRPNGRAGRECQDFRYSLRELRHLYAHTLAAEFGPLALKAVRQQMIAGGLCRRVINQRIGRVKALFRWAASEELIGPTVDLGLRAVAGLRAGHSTAPDRPDIRPVDDADYEATLPHCPAPIASMLRVLRNTGMRPGELCILRPVDLDRSGAVWTYRPHHHKGSHRGRGPVVFTAKGIAVAMHVG